MEFVGSDIGEIVLPVKADERWGPRPGRWRDQIPNHTNRIPVPPPYRDNRTELQIERPEIPYWPEQPTVKEPTHEMDYEHIYDDGRLAIIRGPDAIYRRE